MRPVVVALAILSCAAAGGAVLGMRAHRHAAPGDANALAVPRTSTPIKIDGELDEPPWTGNPARTGAFPGKPYSDARMLWDDTTMYLALYAADEDIETRTTTPDGPLWLDDAFRLTFVVKDTEYRVEVSPKCIITDGKGRPSSGKMDYAWSSGARVACDTDGTINEPDDMDEEWVVEMALPLESMGIERDAPFDLSIERCDTPKKEPRSCTSWKRRLVLR